MGLFDGLTADQRARALLAHEDLSRTHWNFLPESGRHGISLGELDRGQEMLAHRLIAESMSTPAYARVVQVMANEHVLRKLNRSAFGHAKPPADFVTRTVATIGEVEYPDYHGVGRRDAMITDEDRKALAYFRAHPRGLRAGDLSAIQRGHFDDLLARFVERARPDLVGFEMDRKETDENRGRQTTAHRLRCRGRGLGRTGRRAPTARRRYRCWTGSCR